MAKAIEHIEAQESLWRRGQYNEQVRRGKLSPFMFETDGQSDWDFRITRFQSQTSFFGCLRVDNFALKAAWARSPGK